MQTRKENAMKIFITIIFVTIYSIIVTATVIRNDTTSIQLKKVQDAIEQKNAMWRASETGISKRGLGDQKLIFGGPLREFIKTDDQPNIKIPIIHNLPSSFSWRDNNGDWLTPAKNQQVQQCGSCWAFAAAGIVESWWKITNNEPDSMIDLSEQYLISCSPAGKCAGAGWASHALEWISQCGIPQEDCMPYMASDTVDCESCCKNWEEGAIKIPGWSWVTTDAADIVSIKNAVYHQPVVSHMDVYEDFRYYSGGLYEHVIGNYLAGHAVIIYGWDNAEQSWLCKNSIGQEWGEEGNFRIKWGDCGIGLQTLMIWDGLTDDSLFIVTPREIKAELVSETSLETSIMIINKNINKLEFTSFVYRNEPTFHSSAYNSYDDSSIWCGDEEVKGYGNWWIKYLDTPVLDLSTTSAPEFSCLMKWSTDGDPINEYDGRDGGNLMISIDGGKNFNLLVPETPVYNCDNMLSHWMHGIPFGTGSWSGMTDWQHVYADLSDYKTNEVVIRFTFFTTDNNCTTDNPAWKGLFIDSLLVKDINTIIYENQGNNIDEMRRSGIGGEYCDWIEIQESPCIVSAGDSIRLNFKINTTRLNPGCYKGSIVLSTNNKYYKYYEIPIELDVITSISSSPEMIPKKYALLHNYPNPFNPYTTIRYTIPKSSTVTLTIYDLLGREITTLVNKTQTPGEYSVIWHGHGHPSGIYICRLNAGDFTETRKLVLQK
jgi:C1A family cysteine protease